MKNLHVKIDEWGADLAVSFHFNSSDNKKANGMEVLHSGYFVSEQMAKQLMMFMSKNITCIKSRGIKKVDKKERGGAFLHYGKAPAILIEPFFGSSEKDFTCLMKDPQKLSIALTAFFRDLKTDFKIN